MNDEKKENAIFLLVVMVFALALGAAQMMPLTVLFQWLLRLEPGLLKFKEGTYRFMPGMTVREMLALLASGKEAQFSIRFVEGSRLRDWLETLKTAPYLDAQRAG